VPFNLKQNEALTMSHLQERPVLTDEGFKGSAERVSLMKACEEVGVNMVTVRSAESGNLRSLQLPDKIGQDLQDGVPRILQLMKSIEVEGTNIHNESTDRSKTNRWAGFSIGTNDLIHLEENLQVLTLGKTAKVQKYFDVDKLRAIANLNFQKRPKWSE
jgi:hypothetical protein